MSYQVLSDEMLLKLLKASDEDAYRQIYTRYWKSVFLSAYSRVHVKEVAEELVQNIFLSLWEKRDSQQIERLEAYLSTSVKYQVLNYVKACIIREKYASRVKKHTTQLEEDTDSALVMHELSAAINNAISQLPDKTRLIF